MKKLTKKRVLMVGIILVVVLFLGLNQKLLFNADKGPVKIGVILPLSGNIANWGLAAQNGIEVAMDDIVQSKDFGNNFELIYEDDQCDNAKAVTAIQKLINIDKVKVIIGPLCSGSILATAPIAEDAKVILLGFGSAAAISDAGDYIFRHTYSDAQQGTFLAEQIYNRFNFHTTDIIYVNNGYGVGLFNGFQDSFVELGGQIINRELYNPDVVDFRTILMKLKNSQAEVLLIISYGKEGGLLVKQVRELGMEKQIFSTDNFGTSDVLAAAGDLANGTVFSFPIPLDEQDDKIQGFKNRYLAVIGQEPNILFVSASGYDAIMILNNIVREYGYDADNVRKALYNLKDYLGLSGIISFDSNGDASKFFSLQIVKGNQFVLYEE